LDARRRFDFAKLENLNGHYMRHVSRERLEEALPPVIDAMEDAEALRAKLDAGGRARLEIALPSLAERAKTVRELVDNARFLWASRPIALDEKAEKLLGGDAPLHLAALHDRLASVDPWTAERLEEEVRDYADEAGLKLGKVAQPLRAALTGQSTSPGIFDVLVALGRAESLGRIADRARAQAA